MKIPIVGILFLLLFCTAIPFQSSAQDIRSGRIVGGSNASIADYPWQVALLSFNRPWCGGSIITERWILTAAHCVVDQDSSNLTVRAGVTLISDNTGQNIAVDSVTIHPQYNSNTEDNDIALLYLIAPLNLTTANATAIPMMTEALATTGLQDPGVTTATITGWGNLSEGGDPPDNLQVATVPIISNADADAAYAAVYDPGSITAGMIAAGYEEGLIDSCQGDSGGPLVVPDVNSSVGYILAGITSWGEGCARPGYPGIYARVSHYQTWLEEQLENISDAILQNDVPLTGLSGVENSPSFFTVQAPSGAQNLTIQVSGGTGDVDLYVRYNAKPNLSEYDCRPFLEGNSESCQFPDPSTGTYHIMLNGYAAFSGVTLLASYTVTPPVEPLFRDGFDVPIGR